MAIFTGSKAENCTRVKFPRTPGFNAIHILHNRSNL